MLPQRFVLHILISSAEETSVCMSTGTSKSCGERGPPLQRAPVSGSQPCHMAASVMRACVNGRFTSLMTNFQGSGLCRRWDGTFRVLSKSARGAQNQKQLELRVCRCTAPSQEAGATTLDRGRRRRRKERRRWARRLTAS